MNKSHHARLLREQANHSAVQEAKRLLALSPLARLQEAMIIVPNGEITPIPEVACVDPFSATVHLNLHEKRLDASAWAYVIGQQLLHLAFHHTQRCEGREPLLWNIACDIVADRMLSALGISTRSQTGPWSESGILDGSEREETVYEILITLRESEGRNWQTPTTLAGKGIPDILGLTSPTVPPHRDDLAERFVRGVQLAAAELVAQQALEVGDAVTRDASWPPLARARRWVREQFPLLAAVAEEIRIIVDQRICSQMDISVAAVNPYLGEMYFNPEHTFTYEEVLFVYVHELLHVALFHHTRLQGRDPYLWNLATDFVINGWLVEMGIGQLPKIGGLFDPELAGMGAEEIYDRIVQNPKACRKMRGFRGAHGDIIFDAPFRRIFRGDVTTMEDLVRRRLREGYDAHIARSRGIVSAGLLEEIRSLYTPPVPWDVELAKWMEKHIPLPDDWRRSFARASRRQASTPEIPRAARYLPQEAQDAVTFGVVLDTSGSMDRGLLGRALGAIASYADSREVPAVRLVLCDATPYDRGYVTPTDLRGLVAVVGRGGTVLQPAIAYLCSRKDFPESAPVMIITDGWCEEEIHCPREHCFLFPRKRYQEGAVPLRTTAPIFRVLKEEHEPD